MYSKETYEQAFELRKEGLSYLKISRKLNIPSLTTIYAWVKKGKMPQGRFLDENHNKLSPELGYILGVICGDGYISFSRTKGCIGLDVKDKDFALFFREQLEKWCGVRASFRFRRDKGLYITILYSLRATRFLRNFDIFSLVNADKRIKSNFIRGFFDSDGGVSGSNLDKPRISTRFIAVYNNDKKLILFIKDLLGSLGIKVQNIDKRIGSSFNPNNINYRLRIGGRENIKKFKEKIAFSIERKNKKLDAILNSYREIR